MALNFFPTREERDLANRKQKFLNDALERFDERTATLEQLAAGFGTDFPNDPEGFPYDFALRMEQSGIPPRFIRDLEMQCVSGDLETMVNSFRTSYVLGGITRDDYYALVDKLRGLVQTEYEGKAGKADEEHARLKAAAEGFMAREPRKDDVDAFFSMYRQDYFSKAVAKRQLFREFGEFFQGSTRSFDFFQYELAEVVEGRKLAPKDVVSAREEARLVEKLQEKGAFYVIEMLSLKPEYIADVLIAMYPDLAHQKDELRRIFGPANADGADARSLRQFLGICRKRKADTIGIYDGRRNALGQLSEIATKVFEANHGADRIVTAILADAVKRDYQQLFRQNPQEALSELERAILEAPHPYVQLVLTQARDHYQRIVSAKLVGVMPRITVR